MKRKTRDRKRVGKGRVSEEGIIYKVNTGKERGSDTSEMREKKIPSQEKSMYKGPEANKNRKRFSCRA